jgi:hypothetical protein
MWLINYALTACNHSAYVYADIFKSKYWDFSSQGCRIYPALIGIERISFSSGGKQRMLGYCLCVFSRFYLCHNFEVYDNCEHKLILFKFTQIPRITCTMFYIFHTNAKKVVKSLAWKQVAHQKLCLLPFDTRFVTHHATNVSPKSVKDWQLSQTLPRMHVGGR